MSSLTNTPEVLKHFRQNDPHMARLFSAALKGRNPIKLPQPLPKNKYFWRLARAITGQQISTKAALAVFKRLENELREIKPTNVLKASTNTLRACGLSERKVTYLKSLAENWSGLPIEQFKNLSDEEIINSLTTQPGIGRWTAEMFLMSALARPDVFAYDDLGLKQSLYYQYNLKPHYIKKIDATVNAWAPFRTYASLTLWYHKDNDPFRKSA